MQKSVAVDGVRGNIAPIFNGVLPSTESQGPVFPVLAPNQLVSTPRKETVAEGSGDNRMLMTGGTFSVGREDQSVSRCSGRNRALKRTGTSWKRLKHNSQGAGRSQQSDTHGSAHDEGDSSAKRKAGDGMEVSSKISKHSAGSMVHLKPSNPQ